MNHFWEVVDVAKERLAGSSSFSNPGSGVQLGTGRKTQRVVKASSTAPVITHTSERPRSAHHDENISRNKDIPGAGLLGIEDSFDKAISLPNSPVSKESPGEVQTRKHETKKAQRRHHTHHLFDGFLHTISGGGGGDETRTKTKSIDLGQRNQGIVQADAINIDKHQGESSQWQHDKTSTTPESESTAGHATGMSAGQSRRWSETSQTKQQKVNSLETNNIIRPHIQLKVAIRLPICKFVLIFI